MTFIIDFIILHAASAIHQQRLASGFAVSPEVTMAVLVQDHTDLQLWPTSTTVQCLRQAQMLQDAHSEWQPKAIGERLRGKEREREDERGGCMWAGRDKQVVPWLSGSNAVSPVCLVWTAARLNSPLVWRPNTRFTSVYVHKNRKKRTPVIVCMLWKPCWSKSEQSHLHHSLINLNKIQ